MQLFTRPSSLLAASYLFSSLLLPSCVDAAQRYEKIADGGGYQLQKPNVAIISDDSGSTSSVSEISTSIQTLSAGDSSTSASESLSASVALSLPIQTSSSASVVTPLSTLSDASTTSFIEFRSLVNPGEFPSMATRVPSPISNSSSAVSISTDSTLFTRTLSLAQSSSVLNGSVNSTATDHTESSLSVSSFYTSSPILPFSTTLDYSQSGSSFSTSPRVSALPLSSTSIATSLSASLRASSTTVALASDTTAVTRLLYSFTGATGTGSQIRSTTALFPSTNATQSTAFITSSAKAADIPPNQSSAATYSSSSFANTTMVTDCPISNIPTPQPTTTVVSSAAPASQESLSNSNSISSRQASDSAPVSTIVVLSTVQQRTTIYVIQTPSSVPESVSRTTVVVIVTPSPSAEPSTTQNAPRPTDSPASSASVASSTSNTPISSLEKVSSSSPAPSSPPAPLRTFLTVTSMVSVLMTPASYSFTGPASSAVSSTAKDGSSSTIAAPENLPSIGQTVSSSIVMGYTTIPIFQSLSPIAILVYTETATITLQGSTETVLMTVTATVTV